MRFEPNFFDDEQRKEYESIRFGSGAPIKSALTKIDGVSTEYKWKKHKAKEKSGSANVYEGMEYKHPKLHFTAVDEEDFDDLRALWDLMQPVPGQGAGGVATTARPGQTVAIGSVSFKDATAAKSAAAEATSAGAAVLQDGGTKAEANAAVQASLKDSSESASTATASKDPDPGPRPPTIAVYYPLLLWHGITACALAEWESVGPTETNGYEVVITIIPDKPPVPAGTGAMAPPAPGSQFAAGAAGNAGGGGGASEGNADPGTNTNKGAAAGAAGT